MSTNMSGEYYGASCIAVGSRMFFDNSSFHTSHLYHWERNLFIDELKDAEAHNLKRWFEPPAPRAGAYLAAMKVTDVGKKVMGKLVWKGKNKWNMKRIMNEWKTKDAEVKGLFPIGNGTFQGNVMDWNTSDAKGLNR